MDKKYVVSTTIISYSARLQKMRPTLPRYRGQETKEMEIVEGWSAGG
jgi:hypothetical protein